MNKPSIPLIKPDFPNMKLVGQKMERVWESRVFTNFGVLYDEAQSRLSEMMNGHSLPVVNGTVALQVAIAQLRLQGAKILVPDFTHTGSINAVIQAGAIPVLSGVNSKTWTLDIEWCRANRDQYDAIMVVSPFGYEVDVPAWEVFSAHYEIPLIYDFAGAFGFFPKTRNPRCYSFHATKNFSTGEGGCVVFPDESDYEEGRKITNFDTLLDRSVATQYGMNGKIDELRAACILANLEPQMLGRIYKKMQNKTALLKYYQREVPYAYVPPGTKRPSLCVLGGLDVARIEREGLEQGIVFRRYYPLLSRMSAFDGYPRISESGPEMATCIALPSDASIYEADRVIKVINQTMKVIKEPDDGL